MSIQPAINVMKNDVQYNNNVNDSNNANNETDGLLYGLDEIQKIISKQFQGAENLKFQPNTCNLTTIKENFHQLVNILTLPIEYGSGYYWEIRQMHLVTRKKEFTGCAMVYLGCIQREDRKWKRPQNTPVKRRSEAHAAINRYDCMEILKGVFLEVAKHWIQKNVKYNLQNPELYKHLQYHKLINAQIHAKEQVYYWASVFSKRIYMFNSENQLSSVKEYLKEHSCFKTICYLENDFIKALGFTTPLFNRIGHLISKII
ncbi:unnamed protein product [Rhizophagus irregularis]|nr:unnamed protein product [Rhizophagus irregularis]